jgi:multidrug efflux pump subunit AcrA (membrane-fusion protein)
LKPIGGVTNVSPPFNSLVQRVLVREGQLVQAGQPLLLLRNDALRKQRRRLVAITASWRKEVAVLASQLGLPSELPNDTAALRQLQVGELEVQLRRLAAQEEAARIAINTQQQISELEGFQRKLTINQQITERMRQEKWLACQVPAASSFLTMSSTSATIRYNQELIPSAYGIRQAAISKKV